MGIRVARNEPGAPGWGDSITPLALGNDFSHHFVSMLLLYKKYLFQSNFLFHSSVFPISKCQTVWKYSVYFHTYKMQLWRLLFYCFTLGRMEVCFWITLRHWQCTSVSAFGRTSRWSALFPWALAATRAMWGTLQRTQAWKLNFLMSSTVLPTQKVSLFPYF